MSLYYQPSNKLPLGGVATFLIGGVAAAVVLAFVYIYAEWYIPFIYINFILCAAFGLLLGFVLMLLVRAGKLRSPGGVALLTVLVGLVAVYVQWALYLTLLFNSENVGVGDDAETITSFNGGLFVGFLTSPGNLWTGMQEINATGVWTLKGTTPTGIFLWIIWLAEAAAIVGAAYFVAVSQADEPFSELANEWADEETLARPVAYSADDHATRTALESGQHHTLVLHEESDDELAPFSRLKLYAAANDDSCRYLTLENVTRERDKKGKITETSSVVVKRLAITDAIRRELRERFGAVVM